MPAENGAQTLLIDADDTLWENNIYFERAIAKFISFLDHREHSPEAVRLVQIGFVAHIKQVVQHPRGQVAHVVGAFAHTGATLGVLPLGTGNSFAHSLVETFEKLSVEPVTPELHERIRSFAHQIADHPIEVLPGVPETLQYLGERHHLILMTKGNPAEQSGKVERSGLKEYFAVVEIVAEKDESTYRAAIAKYALPADTTWMVGNSPKSDINPALAAGLHAVFIPHDNTWILEHEEVATAPASQRLLVVDRFGDLREHF